MYILSVPDCRYDNKPKRTFVRIFKLSSADNLPQSTIHSEALPLPPGKRSTETALDSPSSESILDLSALRERLYETAVDVALGLGTVGALIVK